MTVTMANPIMIHNRRGGDSIYRISWTSDAGGTPTFDLYEMTGGGLVYRGVNLSFDAAVANGESPVFWCTDSGAAPADAYPAKLTIQWYQVSGTDYYRIDESVSGSWLERVRVTDTGEWAYRWTTRWLEDVTTHTFRVLAIGTDGNVSTAASVVAFLIRYPDVPDVTYTYASGTAKVTIAAA